MAHVRSSAVPSDLLRYADIAAEINSRLSNEAQLLVAALQRFAATCTEYATGAGAQVADDLRNYTQRTAPVDEWVRQVGIGFLLADALGDMGSPVAVALAALGLLPQIGAVADVTQLPGFLSGKSVIGSKSGGLQPPPPGIRIGMLPGVTDRPIALRPLNRPLTPGSDAWLYKQVPGAHSDKAPNRKVKIATIGQTPDGKERTVVMIAGTDFAPSRQRMNPNNALSAIQEGTGIDSEYYRKVRDKLKELPPGTEVNYVGHSMGGMLARKLANDAELRHLRVKSVTTFGASRTKGDEDRPDVPARHYVEDEDPVAWLGRRTWRGKRLAESDVVTDTGDHVNLGASHFDPFKGHTTYDQSEEANGNKPLFEVDPRYVDKMNADKDGQFKHERTLELDP